MKETTPGVYLYHLINYMLICKTIVLRYRGGLISVKYVSVLSHD